MRGFLSRNGFASTRPLSSVWMLFLIAAAAAAQTSVFNCASGFTSSSGSCQVSFIAGYLNYPFNVQGAYSQCGATCPQLNGSVVEFALPQTSDQHEAGNFMYQAAKVNVQGFISTYTFQGNGAYGPNFVLANNTISAAAGTGSGFTSGAGGEQSFYQGYDTSTGNHAGASSNNNTFGLSIDGYSPTTQGGSVGGNSSLQVYQQNQAPYLPAVNAYIQGWPTSKIDISGTLHLSATPYGTAPTPYQTVSGTADTYSVTVTYTGRYFRVDIQDVTAGSGTYTYYWPVNIPAVVGSSTAWLNLTQGTGSCSGSSCGTYPLNVLGWSFSNLSAASSPTFSIAGGSYGSTQSLTLSASAPVICYSTTVPPATNGGTGCAVGTKYTSAISIPSSETVFAVAGGTNNADSPVVSNFYSISSTPDIPIPSIGGDTVYNGAQQIFLTATNSTSIRYSTSGTFSTCSGGTLYSSASPIIISSNTTLYFLGCLGGVASPVSSVSYAINTFAGGSPGGTPPAAPAFSVAPGTYGSAQTVGLSSSTTGAYICYTTDGTDPYPASDSNASGVKLCNHGTLYSGTFSVSSTTTVKAISALDTTLSTSSGGSNTGTNFGPPSSPSAATYSITLPSAATPTFSPTAGSYVGAQNVTISTSTGSVICYNTTGAPATNGSTGCTTGTLYTGPVTVSSSETLYAIAGGTGYSDSPVGSAAYTITTVQTVTHVSGKAGIFGKTHQN